jgi:hypothetical protein
MRTPDDDRKRARELYALARSTPHADEGLAWVLQAMELEAGAKLAGCEILEPKSDHRRHAGAHLPGAKRIRRA